MSGTSATETQNIAVVKRGYEAFGKGDIETLKTLFTPNAHWRGSAVGVLPGTYRGAQAILEFFGRVAQESAGTLRVEPQTMAASGDHVFVQERLTAKRKGRTIDTKSVLVFKLDKGVVTEVDEYRLDHPAEAQFWS
jgi:ketosteroid isomerase-like protein